MSIVIKGIEMPKESWECPCHNGETGRCKVTGRSCCDIPKDCPLIEIQNGLGSIKSYVPDMKELSYAQSETCAYWDGESNLCALQRPSAQSERKNGKWIPVDVGDCCYRCSECGFIRDAYLLDVGCYCPQCGLSMTGEQMKRKRKTSDERV